MKISRRDGIVELRDAKDNTLGSLVQRRRGGKQVWIFRPSCLGEWTQPMFAQAGKLIGKLK